MYDENMIIPCMNGNIHIVVQLSKIILLGNKTHPLGEMVIARENFRNILDYYDSESLCVVIYEFTKLRHNLFN